VVNSVIYNKKALPLIKVLQKKTSLIICKLKIIRISILRLQPGPKSVSAFLLKFNNLKSVEMTGYP